MINLIIEIGYDQGVLRLEDLATIYIRLLGLYKFWCDWFKANQTHPLSFSQA
jgi:hypothetical protein